MVLSEMSPQMMKTARELLGWNQDELARKSHLSLSTIRRYETGGLARASLNNVEAIITAFKNDGVTFISEGNRIGLTFRRHRRE